MAKATERLRASDETTDCEPSAKMEPYLNAVSMERTDYMKREPGVRFAVDGGAAAHRKGSAASESA